MHQRIDDSMVTGAQAARLLRRAKKAIALSGAGVSVPSGIPDFRSKGGLWNVFQPEEYATLSVFQKNPAKSWHLFRAMAAMLEDKKPNAAHYALAQLEENGLLAAVVTQNIDGLHQMAGNQVVFEIHGEHNNLHCLRCGHEEPFLAVHLKSGGVPLCPVCHYSLKPKVVLFGEEVQGLEMIHNSIQGCDLLLVIGTSAQVYPAAAIPAMVVQQGGHLLELNHEPALPAFLGTSSHSFIAGDIALTLPKIVQELQKEHGERP